MYISFYNGRNLSHANEEGEVEYLPTLHFGPYKSVSIGVDDHSFYFEATHDRDDYEEDQFFYDQTGFILDDSGVTWPDFAIKTITVNPPPPHYLQENQ